jgi:hypothetical protein
MGISSPFDCERMAPMDWVQFVLDFLVTGLLVFLIQLVFQERMKKRLSEFETRFSKLHEKQAEVIPKLFELLEEIQSNLIYYRNVLKSDSDEVSKNMYRETTGESITAFWRYFSRHRLYLPASLIERIELFCEKSVVAEKEAILADYSQPSAANDGFNKEGYDNRLEELSQLIDEEIPALKEDIEKEFRKLLGS